MLNCLMRIDIHIADKEYYWNLIISISIFITWQHAYSCTSRYCFTYSVHLSLSNPVLWQNELIYHTFWLCGRRVILVYIAPLLLQNSRGTSVGALNTRGMSGKVCKYCYLSRKWYKMGYSYYGTLIGSRSICFGYSNLDCPWKAGPEGSKFSVNLHNYTRMVWRLGRITKCSMVTQWQVGRSIFLGDQPRPHPKGPGPQHPPDFWDHVCTQYENQQPNVARWSN